MLRWIQRIPLKLKFLLRPIWQAVLDSIFVPCILVIAALLARLQGRRRKPRLIWGTIPIISIKYLSQAARLYGYESQTFVYQTYSINQRSDYDIHLDEFLSQTRILGLKPSPGLELYFVFIWTLFHFDVFHFFFNGGFLVHTRWELMECQLLKLAGKKIVMFPYGSDIAIVSEMEEIDRVTWLRDYPDAIKFDEIVRKKVRYFTKWADFVVAVAGQLAGWQPRRDLWLFNYICIDTNSWLPSKEYSNADGHNAEVIVVHSPNHRALKGTEHLVKAVEQLQAEGLKIRLDLLEGRPNAEVKEALRKADILAEQFYGGYSLSGIEGMSLGKPVLCNLSRQSPEAFQKTSLRECPVVNTPPEKIKENLCRLAEDPAFRQQLGEASRRYVEKFHSPDAIGDILHKIYLKIWYGKNVDFGAFAN